METKFAIFSDIDGTIYPYSQTIHPDTFVNVKEAQSKKIKFVIATGNPFLKQVQWLSKELNADVAISSNGAYAYDLKANKEVFAKMLNKEVANELFKLSLELNTSCAWWDRDNIYVSKFVTKETIKILETVALKGDKVILDNEVKNDVFKIEFVGSKENIDKIVSKASESNLQCARIHDKHVEITSVNVSKGSALVEVAKYLEVPVENTMAIGDSANDWSMMEKAGFSYAMDNAPSETKEKAKYYTSAVEQNGLGEAIIDFMFRNRLTDNFKNNREIHHKKTDK